MRNISPFVRNLAILALVALAIVLLNLEVALLTIGLIVRIAFFLAIAFVAYMLWRDFGRAEIATWPSRPQWVFYGAVGLLVADLGWWFWKSPSGRDALVAIVVVAICVFAGIRTWREQHRYS